VDLRSYEEALPGPLTPIGIPDHDASLLDICAHCVETDSPNGTYRLHRLSRSEVSYMLQIILWTNWTVMDCWTLPYTLSLYGHMLIIVIIVLILLMSIVLNFYCSLL